MFDFKRVLLKVYFFDLQAAFCKIQALFFAFGCCGQQFSLESAASSVILCPSRSTSVRYGLGDLFDRFLLGSGDD